MSTETTPFATVEEALEDIAAGKMVVVVDDEDRENEGDLVMAAQFVTPDAINFMTRQAGGWICLALTPERCDELGLDLMAAKNESAFETPFTVTIEAKDGVTTGISAADRAVTIKAAVGLCGDRFGADVMNETLRRSSLAEVRSGTKVNLELALAAAARLGGHFVQGHVDGVGAVSAVRDDGFARLVTVQADPQLLRYVVEKGSITVDGVSLTVARIDEASFDVSLIPETLERTNLGTAAPGTPVNLEVDILAKYVEKLVRRDPS